MNITPLDGYCIAITDTKLSSIESETAAALGLQNFTVVDSKAGRNEALTGKTRVRKFTILEVFENADEKIRNYVGKHAYCVCFENENENNITVDSDTGDKLWFIPIVNILGFDKDN